MSFNSEGINLDWQDVTFGGAIKGSVDDDKTDAERYRKLRRWMSSNVPEGWNEVQRLAAIACYVDWDTFDKCLDELPDCNVGLCEERKT